MRRCALLAAVVGLAAAPAASAVPQPSSPRATLVMIPGSGFNGAGAENAARMSFRADVWREWGFRTRIAKYRRGKTGLTDVTRAVERAHAAAPNRPLCLYGESSGGTWALLVVAQHRTLVDCAIVLAAPTDQETLAYAQHRPARHLARTVWPRYFGRDPDDNVFEPFDVWSQDPPTVPVLMGYSEGDHIVPPQQGELFAPLNPFVELRVLKRGPHYFVHADVNPRSFSQTRRAARALVNGVVRTAGR